MSRKNAPKSNIGIFEGKKSEYNRQILKTLAVYGPSTAWEIAKKICGHKYPDVSDYELETRARHVYSIIQRKKGRLQDLLAKKYVGCEDKTRPCKWGLMLKGVAAILIIEPTLINKIHTDYIGSFSGTRTIEEPELTFGPFKIQKKAVDALVKAVQSEIQNPYQSISRIAKITKNLIDEGIDLDRIKGDKLELLIAKAYAEEHFEKRFSSMMEEFS